MLDEKEEESDEPEYCREVSYRLYLPMFIWDKPGVCILCQLPKGDLKIGFENSTERDTSLNVAQILGSTEGIHP